MRRRHSTLLQADETRQPLALPVGGTYTALSTVVLCAFRR
jgi:hypothetical protein